MARCGASFPDSWPVHRIELKRRFRLCARPGLDSSHLQSQLGATLSRVDSRFPRCLNPLTLTPLNLNRISNPNKFLTRDYLDQRGEIKITSKIKIKIKE